jgi:hypothetical protein
MTGLDRMKVHVSLIFVHISLNHPQLIKIQIEVFQLNLVASTGKFYRILIFKETPKLRPPGLDPLYSAQLT